MTGMVPSGDLSREYREIRTEIDEAVAGVLAGGWFVLGPAVENFEQNFANYLETKFCVGVGSGTDGLALALMACDVSVGDEVITVAHTAIPTISAISMVGATPVFVDIRSDTCLMDAAQVEAAITPRTAAIMPVHLYGQCVDMAPLTRLSRARGIPIIEDCAQAHGACLGNKKAGTIGVMGVFSFYPSKNLGCYGDGGAIATNDPEIARKLKMLRNYGQRERYFHDIKGINSRLDELQAAILNVKLPYLDEWNNQRLEVARRYDEGLKESSVVASPVKKRGRRHVYHLYVVQTPRRDELRQFLGERNVQTLIHYPLPAHQQKAYLCPGAQLPVTDEICDSVLSLPCFPQLTPAEVDRVIEAVREFAS